MPKKKFQTVCQGIFYSKMCYCLKVVGNVWGVDTNDEVKRRFSAYTKDDNRKLQTLQNMVLRMKTDMPRRTPTKTLLALSGDLSVQQLTAQATLTSLQKVIHNGKPEYLADKLKLNTMNTRQENTVRQNSKLTLTRGAYFYRASVLFSNLPPEMRTRMEPQIFKAKAKAWVRLNIPPKPP